ncbi:Putative NADPH-quinone reductase (modulator of drug activity B) [Scardovia inopinata]|uniref:Uncharacterized protein n=1 Tax=Scardovia inopinata F0304 TaxID=641146 RepID=W1MX98_SCAIO|nr:NAD(P)H-dependent oxidoreductase [Scardovia inopinata]EQW15227.1 hypothetical protein HMPREF9020_01541 [Scardovia inopinata F0304]SUV51421.1 Putative NADPH-quinone reductase (modulator of drug activity B) [Scardovia inopinata]
MNDPETKKYSDVITRSDILIFVYPIWWSGMPASLNQITGKYFTIKSSALCAGLKQ